MKKRQTSSRSPATLLEHVRELRTRLFVSFIILVIVGGGAYFFYEPILNFLRAPLDAPLYYSNPAGSFSFLMKVCTLVGVAAAVPVLTYNLIMFIRPAFQKALTKKRVWFTTFFSLVLAAAGVGFAYTFIIPGALRFFAGFQVEGLNALISADSYLSFVINVMITFILAFQLPLLLTLIDHIKPIPPKGLFKGEKWVLLGSLLVSLLVPFALDLTVSLMIAAPIFALYNISIVLVLIQQAVARKRHAPSRTAAVVKPEVVSPALAPAPVILTAPPSPLSIQRAVRSMDIIRPQQRSVPRRPIAARPVISLERPVSRGHIQPPLRLISDIRPQGSS